MNAYTVNWSIFEELPDVNYELWVENAAMVKHTDTLCKLLQFH